MFLMIVPVFTNALIDQLKFPLVPVFTVVLELELMGMVIKTVAWVGLAAAGLSDGTNL